ncbi:MAG: hypothetical protein KBD56_01780 [Candidatus Eisenbacteria bacterium]|nr:hypothetical protein [Candidatus Eisenbacteria bacterium]
MTEHDDGRAQGVTLRDFLSVLFRRKWILIAVVGATLAIVIHSLLRAAPVYESYSKLLVSRGQATTAFSSSIKLLSWEEELSSEIEVIRSAKIFQRAQEILDEDGTRDDLGTLVKIDPAKVTANTPGKSHVIHIVYQSGSKGAVQPAVRAMTQAYQEFRTDTRLQDPTVFLDDEIERLRGEIEYWEEQRAEYLTNAGSVELPQERINALNTKRSLEVELATARTVVAERQARLDWINHNGGLDAESEIYSFPDDNGRGETIVSTLHRRILDLKAEYFSARAQYTDNHPKVLTLRQELDELEQTMKEESNLYLDYLTAQLAIARSRVSSLENSLDYLDGELRTYPDREAKLASLDRTIESLRTTHDALVQRRADALTLRLGTSMWDVVVLQDAVLPFRVGQMDYVRMAVLPIFSLLVAIGLAFLVDGLDQSFRDVREVESALKVPSLATIRRFRR